MFCVGVMFGNKPAVDEAFGKAKHTVKLRLENNRLIANAMEPRGALGDYSSYDETFTLYTSTQNPHGVRFRPCAAWCSKMPETKAARCRFRCRRRLWHEGRHVPRRGTGSVGSKRCGKPVEMVSPSRSEGFLTDDLRPRFRDRTEMAFDDTSGVSRRCAPPRCRTTGAYVCGAAVVTLVYTVKLISGVYDIPAVHVASKALFTKHHADGPYRGAGRPEAAYISERLMDEAAKKLGIDSPRSVAATTSRTNLPS